MGTSERARSGRPAGIGTLAVLCLAGFTVLLSACTVLRMSRESDAMERRIASKQERLRQEEARSLALQEQRRRLDLQQETVQTKVDDLNRTLEMSKKRVDQMKATTQQDLLKKRQTEQRIREIQGEMDALKDQPDIDAKQKRIEELQEEADALLRIPLGL